MTDATDLSKLVPGFDFLQTLMKNAGTAAPSMGQWVAPTLDPAELEKRITELKTVKFWLEQNARLLDATVQALEVQRMTLATLKTMNLPMADLGQALLLRPPAPAPAWFTPSAAATPPAQSPAPIAEPAPAIAPAAPPAPAAVDPMQWWGALTQQFGQLAQTALNDSAVQAAKNLAQAAAPAATAQAAPSGAATVAKKASPARKKPAPR